MQDTNANGIPDECEKSVAARDLPTCFIGGEALTARVSYVPPTGTFAIDIEDTPPTGWVVSDISNGGSWDTAGGNIKWSFLDGVPRTVHYTAVPPAREVAVGCLDGTIRFNSGPNLPIEGDSCVAACGDSNLDSDTDLNDFAAFRDCVTGKSVGALPSCDVFDFDRDSDIDLLDWAWFQIVFTGP